MVFFQISIVKRAFLFISIMVCAFLNTGCFNDEHYAPVALLKEIDRKMAPDFVKGAWRYRGARAIKKGVAIYIQIPDRLDISESQHKNYLVQTICPNRDEQEFWLTLARYELYIRTYNYVDRNYIEAKCPGSYLN